MFQDSPIEKIKKWENGDHICMLSVFFLRALRYTKKLSFLRFMSGARLREADFDGRELIFPSLLSSLENVFKMLECCPFLMTKHPALSSGKRLNKDGQGR